jgi:ribonuclease D
MKGARNLRGRRRSAAARLAAWREREALRSNRPRQWIAKDAALIDIAARLPTSIGELDEIDDLPGGLVRRSGKRLLEVVAESAVDDHSYQPTPAPNEEQKLLVKNMQKLVAECAEGLGLSAETVASKKELSAIVLGGARESRVFSGWRRELIGDDLFKLL